MLAPIVSMTGHFKAGYSSASGNIAMLNSVKAQLAARM